MEFETEDDLGDHHCRRQDQNAARVFFSRRKVFGEIVSVFPAGNVGCVHSGSIVRKDGSKSNFAIPSMSVFMFAGLLLVFEMNPDKPAAQKNCGKIQPYCVVPLEGCLGHGAGRTHGGNQSKCPEQQVHDDSRAHH